MAEVPKKVKDLYAKDEQEAETSAAPAQGFEVQEDEDPGEQTIPEWAVEWIPEGMKIPPGRKVVFLRFKSKWTDAPDKGVPSSWKVPEQRAPGEDDKPAFHEEEHLSRVLICWGIIDKEERNARKRAGDDKHRLVEELTKSFIRAVDGKRSDGGSGAWAQKDLGEQFFDIHTFWRELGPKCRRPVINLYDQFHNLKSEEWADFFLNGLVVIDSVG